MTSRSDSIRQALLSGISQGFTIGLVGDLDEVGDGEGGLNDEGDIRRELRNGFHLKTIICRLRAEMR